MNRLLLWIAEGFGVGRIPFGPGTFGSLLGLLWSALLLLGGNLWVYVGGTIFGLVVATWICGAAENVLHRTDPPSVVLDEIAAMPACFIGWIALAWDKSGAIPAPAYFVSARIWPLVVGVFVAFRFFDIVKPWPVRQSQSLHGGLGVVVDDLLAAVYVNVMVLSAYAARIALEG